LTSNYSMGGAVLTDLGAGSAGTDAPTVGQVALLGGAAFTGFTAPAVVFLADAATITVSAAAGNDFRATLAGNRTLASPSDPANGQRIIFQFTQDGTGGRLLSYGTAYAFTAALPAPVLSAAPGATDVLGFVYNATTARWLFVAFVPGFA
jgi:hypothetical protein